MTRNQRERWETKTLQNIRTHLRKNLAILTFFSTEDKKEIEDRVIAKMQETVAGISDCDIENSARVPSFESDADFLALNILEEERMKRDFFEWES